MYEYTDEDIEKLVSCEKKIVESMRQSLKNKGNWEENEMKLQDKSGSIIFSLFLRKNTKFLNSFSVGLNHIQSPEDSRRFTIIRMNGKHLSSPVPKQSHQFNFHTHKITATDLNNDVLYPKGWELRKDHTFAESALIAMVQLINIQDWTTDVFLSRIHQSISQEELFPNE